ncbi:MAG: DUF3306 domain-containing protein [Telluria sp.]
MAEERFLARWARLKGQAHVEEGGASPSPPVPRAAAAPAAGAPLPTLDDVARLGADSDYSAFVARGVDAAVRRGALRKLFADPHFNTMDGLDVYIGDYTRASPLTETMLAGLRHAGSALCRLAQGDEAAPDTAPESQPDEHRSAD